MLGLLRAEWFKLTRRPLVWVLLVIFVLTFVLNVLGWFLVVAVTDGTFTGGQTRIAILTPAMIDEFRQRVMLPGVLGAVLGHANGIGGLCGIVLAAMAMGSEYNWGTLRVQLSRMPQRTRYLLAKVIVVVALVLMGIIIVVPIALLLAWSLGSVLGDAGSLSVQDVLLFPVGLLQSLAVMLPYLLVTFALSIVGRSVFLGVAGGLVFLGIDSSTTALNALAGLNNPLISFLLNLPLQQNINTLLFANGALYGLDMAVLFGQDPAQLPPLWQAWVMIGLYSVVFWVYSYISLTRRDVGGAT